MTKIHICSKCSKVLANRHSLSRHKKNCRGGKIPKMTVPLPFTHKEIMEKEKKRLCEQVNPKFTVFPEKKDDDDDSIDDESVESKYDVDSNDLVWRRLVFMTDGNKKPVLQELVGLLFLYKQKGSELFHKMVSDVEHAKSSLHFSEDNAIEYGIEKNKDTIMEMMSNCEMHKGNAIWCLLAGRKLKPGCLWFSGERCRCCNGLSALDHVRYFLEMYYGMKHDELLRKINEDIDECIGEEELEDDGKLMKAIRDIVEQHREKVLEEVDLAQQTIGENEWERHKLQEGDLDFEGCDCEKGSGLYLNPYKPH